VDEQPGAARVAEFDAFADHYGDAVQRSIAFAGHDHEYFTRRKAEHLLDVVSRRLGQPAELRALDVGCGVGGTDAFLVDRFAGVEGVDTSEAAIRRAAEANSAVAYRAYDGRRLPYEDERFDVAFAICVVHHVQPPERPAFMAELRRVVRPGGLVVIFEHNPFNPLTRLAVHRCAFDEDTVLVRPKATRQLLRAGGLRPVEGRYVSLLPTDRPAT
jgi:SAM-dependent methyltransferase